MAPKAHGTAPQPLQANLRFGVDPELADKITCFNRHAAENSGYMFETGWQASRSARSSERRSNDPLAHQRTQDESLRGGSA